MWKFVLLSSFTIAWTTAQNKGTQRPFDNGYGWDIRLAVPGEPGNDYPTLSSIPRTSFTCSGKEPGYYADVETNCQAFRVCTFGSTHGFQSFLCPNGTLFNQAVFVCDWWMKVNCKKSTDFFKVNNDKFVNLKLGSQFMTDIKKMITHPLRNPYDDIYTKSKLFVMQEYKPPPNQLYNGTLLSNFNRSPNHAYFETKQSQRNLIQDSTTDISFPASTPRTQYFSNFNIFQTTNTKSAESIPKHKQFKPYVLLNRTGHFKNLEAKGFDIINYSKNTLPIRPTQVYQRSIQSTQTIKSQERGKEKDGSAYTFEHEVLNNNRIGKSKQIGILKQQLHQNIHRDKLLNNKNTQAQYSKIIGQTRNEAKQNLVSNDTPSAIIAKTLAFRKIIKDSTNGSPKSRITFKTWIVRPSKNSKLVIEPTSYTYRKPTNSFEKIIADIPDDNNVNSSIPKVETESNDDSYVYNIPTVKLNDQILTTSKEIFNLPSSSTTSPEITSYPVSTSLPTTPSSLYLVPTTFKPPPLYLPPTEKQISRQYLSPIIENSQFVAASSPRPFLAINKSEPSFFLSKQTHINTNHNNLAFSDILTKEKLDITVNDIVKDTNNVLETASPEEFQQNVQLIDYSSDSYLYPQSDTQSDEKLILQPPPPLPKSSRLITAPSINLEPPFEPLHNIDRNNNEISNLPYFEESTRQPNTIERTVSLKITIPENIADLLFKTNSTTFSEPNVEILNTGNSNNWVLTKKADKNNEANVIPIGKLIWNKNSNMSNSQDLVFSFLIDSINAAKDYNNIVQQSIASPLQPTPTQPQFQSVKNEELQRISNDISQLTSSQFSEINSSSKNRLANQKISSLSDLKSGKEYVNTKSINGFLINQQAQVEQHNLMSLQQNAQQQVQSKTFPMSDNKRIANLDINSDKIYSGQLYQLPVPVVTKQIYNSLYPTNFKLSNNIIRNKPPLKKKSSGKSTNEKIINDSNTDFNIIQSNYMSPNTFQSVTSPSEVRNDQRSSANAIIDNLELPGNGITAQLQDNIVGTLPHPLDEDKLIKYKKDQTYYIYSHLNNDDELNTENQINNIQNIITNNLANRIFSQNDKLSHHSTFQLIPSLNYKLENEKEKQQFLNTFHINEYGSPKQILSNEKENLIRRQDIVASDVDFTVYHPKLAEVENPRFLNALYDGPNSYSAPQRSVGKLMETQSNLQSDSNYNSKIEKFDTDEDKNLGYPKIIPAKRFLF